MDIQQLEWAVRTATEGTPYEVVPKDYGFDVRLDLADSTWWTTWGKANLRKALTHQVRMLDDGRYSITDTLHEVTWTSAGVPRMSASMMKGRLQGGGFERSWGVREDGSFGEITDYQYDVSEGRDIIRRVAREHGLEEAMGGAQRIGVVFAVIGGLAALATVIAFVVVFLLR